MQKVKIPILLGWSWLLFWVGSAQAQQCLAEVLLSQSISTNSYASQKRLQAQAQMEHWLQSHSFIPESGRVVVEIPVVVHIVWRVPGENISDEQVFSQINVLNEDFRLLNANQSQILPLFQGLKADLEIAFVLAQEDPAGQPSTGIVRRQTTYAEVGLARTPDNRRRICYTEAGGSDAWCPNQYLNIWVGQFPAGISGEASFPAQDTLLEDGVRIDPEHFGTLGSATAPYHQGRTATHEIGHFFNLYHLWGGTGDEDPLCQYDDEVVDTPEQNYNYRGQCPSGLQISCGSPDMYQNFLNYTDDACLALFTQGQKARVWAVLNGPRMGLMGGGDCTVDLEVPMPGPALLAFPNPGATQCQIQGIGSGAEIAFLDARGRLILRVEQYEPLAPIQLATLPAGLYFIRARWNSGISTTRYMVIR